MEEEVELFVSHPSLDDWQPLNHMELLLSVSSVQYQVCLPQTHMPQTEIDQFRTCYTRVHHEDGKALSEEATKEILAVKYDEIQKWA